MRRKLVILSVAIVLHHFICVHSSGVHYIRRNNELCPQSRTIGSLISENKIRCAVSCMNFNGCLGYCYSTATRQCLLLDYDSGSSENAAGFSFYFQKDRDGWQKIGDKFYKLMADKQSKSVAASECSDIGMSLAIPENTEENEFLLSLIPEHGVLWLGATDEAKENNWKNEITGQLLTYSYWHVNQPVKDDRGQNCAIFNTDSLWHDYPCTRGSFKFVCEVLS